MSAPTTGSVGRTTRLALLAAGALAQIAAVRPTTLPGAAALAIALLALTGATFLSIHRPLPATANGTSPVTARTWLAGIILLAFALVAATHLHPGDTESLGRSIAAVLVATQVGQALVLRTPRDAAFACVLVGVLLLAAGMFATGGAVAFAIVPALAALAAAAAELHRDSVAALSDLPQPTVRSRARGWLGPAAAAGAVTGVSLLLVSATTELGTQAHFKQAVAHGSSNGSDSTGSGGAAAGAVDLRNRAALTDTPVLSSAASSPTYLEGAAYDHFDGSTWTTIGGAVIDERASGPVTTRTDVITVLQHGELDTTYAPGRVISVAPARGASGSAGYAVTSTSPAATPESAPATTTGADIADPRWRQLPAELPARVTALAASLTAGATTRAGKVAAIESYLQGHEQYQLNSPVPALGEDAVDDFLFVSHRGFCEQFASADIVLLRTLGIPARLVTGYAFGDTATTPGTRIMRGKDAHAWVQVWYPGTGWVSSDPTANAALAAADATAHPSLFHRLFAPLDRLVRGQFPGGKLALAGLLAMLAALVAAVRALRSRRRRSTSGYDDRTPTDPPALAALLDLNAELSRTGEQRRADESLREFGRRINGPDLAQVLETVEAECYAGRPVHNAEVERAVAAIHAWLDDRRTVSAR